MKTTHINFTHPAIIGLALILPFIVLEVATNAGTGRSSFPVVLWILLWLHVALFTYVGLSIWRTYRADKLAKANPFFLGLKVILMGLIAWSWTTWIVDQWPCFLGATGC